MPLTEEQIRAEVRRGLAAGESLEDIKAGLRGGVSRPSYSDPIADLQSQFEGTLAIPQEAIPRRKEVGFGELVPAMLKRSVAVPFTGIGETLGLVDPGTTDELRESTEQTRVDYLAGDPGVGRTLLAGLTELGTEMVPLFPGGKLGKIAAKQAIKKGVSAKAGKLITGAVAGAGEAGVVAVGETVGMPLEERLKRGALITLAGSGLGTLGAYKAIAADHKVKDPMTDEILDNYMADGKKGRKSGSLLERAKERLFNTETAIERFAKSTDNPKIQEDVAIAIGAKRTADTLSNMPIRDGTYSVISNEKTGGSWQDLTAEIDPTMLPDTPQGRKLRSAMSADDLQDDLGAFMLSRRHQELVERKATAEEVLPGLRKDLKEAQRLNDAQMEKHLKNQISYYEKDASLKFREGSTERVAKAMEQWSERYGLEEVTDPFTGTRSMEVAFLGPMAKKFTDFANRSIIDTLGEVGIFSRAQLSAMKRSGEWYTPFRRAIEEMDEKQFIEIFGHPKGSGSAPVRGKRIFHGLDERTGMKVENPIYEIGDLAIRSYSFSRKQRLRNLMADLADEYPETIGKEIVESKGGFRVFRDGELSHRAAPAGVEKALETLNYKKANVIARVSQTMTSIFRAGATLTLNFAFGNFTRDMFPAGIYTKNGVIPVVGPAMAWAEEAFKALAGGVTSKEWKAFLRSFAAHTSLVEGDTFNPQRNIRFMRASGGKKGGVARRTAQEFLVNPLSPFQKISSSLERFNRFPEFKKSYQKHIKEGVKPERAEQLAGLDAQDVTLNFSRAGDLGRTVNLYEAFTNAMFQDISKFSRAMKENPFGTSFKASAYLTAPSLYFWAKYKDDPEYQSLPEWEKALFIHVGKRENGKFVRIPMPPGVLGMMFSYLPRKAAEAFESGNFGDMKPFFTEAVEQTPFRWIPLPGELNSMEDAFINAMPDVVQPIIEVIGNRRPFFDRPVISQRYQRLDPSERKTRYTSNLAKGIAAGTQAFNFNLSPIEVDHYFAGYGAGIGRMITGLSGSDAGRRMAAEDGFIFNNIPGANRFLSVSPYGFGSQPVQEFYDFADKVDQSWSTLKLQSSGQRYRDYIDAHPEALYSKDTRKIRSDLRDLSEERRIIEENDNLSELEKDDALLRVDQAVTMYTGRVMEMFYGAIQVDKQIAQDEGVANAPL